MNIKLSAEKLSAMVKEGIITSRQAEDIVQFCSERDSAKPNIALISFSIIGSVLLAAGIILILAHNWSHLPRVARIFISYFPLVVSQAIGFWFLLGKRDSIPWAEGIASFGYLSIGATLSLISQTYHIQGDFRTFILNWMLLGAPLMYLFWSTTAAVLYIASATTWAVTENIAVHSSLGYWPLIAIVVPFFVMKYRYNMKGKPVSIIGWFLSISLIFGVFWSIVDVTEGYRFISLISLFLVFLSSGLLFFTGEDAFWKTPFTRLGLFGLSVVYIVLSYRPVWDNLSFSPRPEFLSANILLKIADIALSLALPVAALILSCIAGKKNKWPLAVYAMGLPLAVAGFAISKSRIGVGTITIAFNVYVMICGLLYLIHGIRENSGKEMNYGFALIAALVILRFFDSDLTFILRGIIFIILGLSFLGANVFLAQKKAIKA